MAESLEKLEMGMRRRGRTGIPFHGIKILNQKRFMFVYFFVLPAFIILPLAYLFLSC